VALALVLFCLAIPQYFWKHEAKVCQLLPIICKYIPTTFYLLTDHEPGSRLH